MESTTRAGWRIEPVGDRCLMVEFGQRVDPAINDTVHALADRLLEHPIEGVTDVVPAFTTVAIHYRPEALEGAGTGTQTAYRELERRIEAILSGGFERTRGEARTVEIPVCYGGEFGPDLDDVAKACGLSAQQVIELHAASPHVVYMLGFAPGFPYMGGLDARLAMPRRSTPRVRIPAGTVAIAREQSAIYTLESPGGWNLLGRTPVQLFTPHAEPPTLLRPGDHVRFVPITREQFDLAPGAAR